MLLLAAASLDACGGDEADPPSEPTSAVTLGTLRDLPLEDPCQWLTADEAAQVIERTGGEVSPSGVFTVTDQLGMENGADCWYGSRGSDNFLHLTLLSDAEAAANWRETMEEVAAGGGRQESVEKGHKQVWQVGRVADAPTIQHSMLNVQDIEFLEGSATCDARALTGESAVVAINGGGTYQDPDPEAICAAVEDAVETLIGRLPSPESGG